MSASSEICLCAEGMIQQFEFTKILKTPCIFSSTKKIIGEPKSTASNRCVSEAQTNQNYFL